MKAPTKTWLKRQYVWRHNGLRGSVEMMKANLKAISISPSTNSLAKTLARQMLTSAEGLGEAMKQRIDP